MPTATRNRMPIPDAYESFVEGELVMLKSGGPVMTVIGYCDECGEVEAAYGDSEGNLQFHELPSACLLRVQ